jgi:hypothetical protein
MITLASLRTATSTPRQSRITRWTTLDHYEVMHVGWDRRRRVHGSVVHIDIHDGKIWIQYDGTNRPVADELLAAGVPKEDIVLGFHPEDVRVHTGFAVG